MQGTWHQINVTFRDRAAAQQVIPQTLGPALLKAEDREEIAAWWFMNKQPWKLRVRTTGDETPHPVGRPERARSRRPGPAVDSHHLRA